MNRQKKTRRHEAKATTRPGSLHQLGHLHAAGMVPPGRVSLADVVHVDRCPRLRGGPGECRPELSVDVPAPPDREQADVASHAGRARAHGGRRSWPSTGSETRRCGRGDGGDER